MLLRESKETKDINCILRFRVSIYSTNMCVTRTMLIPTKKKKDKLLGLHSLVSKTLIQVILFYHSKCLKKVWARYSGSPEGKRQIGSLAKGV